jgi:glycolate oxidase iron-sulfur subunit
MRAIDADLLDFDEDVVEALDTCVQCRGCEPACPSGVPYGELMEATTRIRRTEDPVPLWLRLGLRLLTRRRLIAGATRLAALPGLSRVTARRLGPLPGRLGRRLRSTSSDPDLWIFTGCVMDSWFRPVHQALAGVAESLGFTIGVAASGHCCGALHVHSGWHEGAVARAVHTMASFPGEQPIVVDSAGCGAALKDYGRMLDTDEARCFAARVVDVHEWLEQHLDELDLDDLDRTQRARQRVVLQDPCHLRHVQRVHLSVRRVLERVVDVVEIGDDGLCCGAGGAYSLLQPDLASRIRERKLEAIRSVDPDGTLVIASANPGCAQHLAAAGLTVVHPIQLVAAARRRQENR